MANTTTMRTTILIAAAACLLLGLACAQEENPNNLKLIPTLNQLKKIKMGLRKRVFKDNKHATALRIAFHHCVGEKCDGCVNLDQEDNKGLEDVVGPLEAFLNSTFKGVKVSDFMTRADLWAVAGIAAVEHGVARANRAKMCRGDDDEENAEKGCIPMKTPELVFEHGRTDCETAPSTTVEHDFPKPDMNRDEMLGFFKDNFDFTPEEVAALMGAHTLGECTPENSGYEGPWTKRPGPARAYFNTQYYKNLVNDDLEFRNVANDPENETDKEFQFNLFKEGGRRGRRIGMMLNTDMELLFNIDVSPTEGTTCKINDNDFIKRRPNRGGRRGRGPRNRQAEAESCPRAAANTADMVELYAEDQDAWLEDFQKVFTKMQKHGYEDAGLITVG